MKLSVIIILAGYISIAHATYFKCPADFLYAKKNAPFTVSTTRFDLEIENNTEKNLQTKHGVLSVEMIKDEMIELYEVTLNLFQQAEANQQGEVISVRFMVKPSAMFGSEPEYPLNNDFDIIFSGNLLTSMYELVAPVTKAKIAIAKALGNPEINADGYIFHSSDIFAQRLDVAMIKGFIKEGEFVGLSLPFGCLKIKL